jgi:hypothetical protein
MVVEGIGNSRGAMAAEPDIAEGQAVDELKRQLAATLEQQTAMSEILARMGKREAAYKFEGGFY